DEPAVHPNRAGVDLFGDAMGAAEVLRPNTRGKPVIHVVRVTNHFFFVVERRDGDDWTKNFFAIGSARDWKIDNYRRRKEIAVAGAVVRRFRRFAAERDLAAFFLRKIDIEPYLLELRLVHDRALFSFLINRIALFQLRRAIDESFGEFLIDRFFDKDARAAQTNLSLVRER